MAVLRNFRVSDDTFLHIGTLAQLSIGADAPRDLLGDVEQADWTPDGTTLAVAHAVDGKIRLDIRSARYCTKLRAGSARFASLPRVIGWRSSIIRFGAMTVEPQRHRPEWQEGGPDRAMG